MAAKTSRKRGSGSRATSLLVLVVFVIVYIAFALGRPLSALQPTHRTSSLTINTQPSNLPWPTYGESALGLLGGSVVATQGAQTSIPTASAAKLITALAVLKKRPLTLNEQGPTITLDATDYNFYTMYAAEDGSVVPVEAGEQISEYQALEAMLLPSANNMADSLARWAYGSVSAYDTYANQYVQHLGLTNTHVGSDASGFLPSTTSTATDLVKLGMLALQNPVLAQIVDQKTAVIPDVGLVYNVDSLLGTDGIIGIKTGNNDQDNGVFVGAATTLVNNTPATIVIAIAGGPNLSQVLKDAIPLVIASRGDFGLTILVHTGEVLGSYVEPWGGTVLQAVASNNLGVTTLQGETAQANIQLNKLPLPAKTGQVVGTISAQATKFSPKESVPIVLESASDHPTWAWRLLHPFSL